MFVAGVSTHKVGEVAQTLLGVARSRQHDQSAQPVKVCGASCANAPIRSMSCTLETSCLSIVWATIQDIRLHKLSLE